MKAEVFIEFCRRLPADAGSKMFLIVDGSRIHTRALHRLQKMPRLVLSFFADPHLAYISG